MMLVFLSSHARKIAWVLFLIFYCDLFCVAETYAAPQGNKMPVTGQPVHEMPGSGGGEDSWSNGMSASARGGGEDIRGNGMSVTASGVGEKRWGNGMSASGSRVGKKIWSNGMFPPVAAHKARGPGPTQPEMQSFSSVNASNMVDLFSGDFSYNIPLMDVGGYPLTLSYRSGISMDQEASWVGLGWNVNPGTITRNLRGLPDDFSGNDSIKKITGIKDNKTIGVTGGVDLEFTGLPIGLGASLGIFNNNYKGWGLENSVNASINAGLGSSGSLSGGLSITNNSQEGLTLAPSLSMSLSQHESEEKAGISGSFSISAPYNSRTGLKGLQLSAGIRQTQTDHDNQNPDRTYTNSAGSNFSSTISFSSPGYTPSITMPFTSRQYSFTGKIGGLATVVHPSFFISGYVSKQGILAADTLSALPAYGYLHYQDGAANKSALMDFNREKELAYRESPPVPHIAVPIYTYDAFSITGEGTGGMFRAYRGDIGYIFDHFIRSKDASDRASVDVGLGDMVHAGVDLNVSRAFTQNGPWLDQNSLRTAIAFRKDSAAFEAAYFRNPGEKTLNSRSYYNTLGGDDVVTVGLFQPGPGSSTIQATNNLMVYHNKQLTGSRTLNATNTLRPERDKRSQVISYLTAQEADVAGLSKLIENYKPGQFNIFGCNTAVSDNPAGPGTGLPGQYFTNRNFTGTPALRTDTTIGFNWGGGPPIVGFQNDNFAIRWLGMIVAPVTGPYTFTTQRDDGIRLWLNDSILINKWNDHSAIKDSAKVNLIKGEVYKIKLEYYEHGGDAVAKLFWSYPGQAAPALLPKMYLYPPPIDTFAVSNYLVKEKRVNTFRKPSHISEIDVLNPDGRKYVYGIPVYNFRQKEATFAVSSTRGNAQTGLVAYTNGTDNSVANNRNGKDWYFNSEEVPAYAHSFLLTGILSPDYVDLTGNGITDDDLGDAVKFNYSKICGAANPFRWRAPYYDSAGLSLATFNDGLKTDFRDDKGNYTYGERELWYIHSVQSKTMVATFTLEGRLDAMGISEAGKKYYDGSVRRLKQIDLYSKADLIRNGVAAKPVKTVHFEYSYELCKGINKPLSDSGKLTLKKVWFTYNNNDKGKQNPYVFNYNSNNPDYNIKSYDRWGNYKDPMQNPGSAAGNILTNAEYPYALQDSLTAAVNAAAWSLDSIYLPSGGSIKAQFESDDYAYVQNLRAMQLFKIAGLGASPGLTNPGNILYGGGTDNLYVYIKVPAAVTSTADVYQKYLTGIKKLYFKIFVKMPGDIYGNGSEYVPCYADLDQAGGYGMVNANLIWVKMSGISMAGDGSGSYSPLVKAGAQFLRMNLPSKAYPGSEIGDNIDLVGAVKLIFSLADNIKNAFKSFDNTARSNGWVSQIDTSRSYVRLDNPVYRKFGGGHRVKKIIVYDNWNRMTGLRSAIYGQEYSYTTRKQINGVMTTISSGVATYEPGIGGEENPFRQPIEYVEKVSAMGPVSLGYSEEPLGESFFPSPSIGYSKVRVRTLNYKKVRSGNGYEESTFYTAYDFPVFTDRTLLDNDTKKRYKPSLSNFLRINSKYYLTLSQGFKVELNDMHGKPRTTASYAETDPNSPIVYTENIYRVEDPLAENKRLANDVMAIHPDGTIDSAALIGKDVELMMDMREQLSITNGNNVSLNTDLFAIPFLPPFFVIPSFIGLAQREENQFRSVATVKVIQRYGILDSIIHIDKGSKVSTRDLLFDTETGEPLLTRTQNEFNDPVYEFNYPAHWAYDGIGPAYKNIGVVLNHISIISGKITGGLSVADSTLFAGGDEVLVGGKQQAGTAAGCTIPYATFPDYSKIWAVDTGAARGGPHTIFFVDGDGNPYSGHDISLKIVRSGRRNMPGTIGSLTSMASPIFHDPVTHLYSLKVNDSVQAVKASAVEYTNYWFRSSTCLRCGTGKSGSNPAVCTIDTVPIISDTFKVCFASATYIGYTSCGTKIYDSYTTAYTPFIRHQLPMSNNWWRDSAGFLPQCNYTPVDTLDPNGVLFHGLAIGQSMMTASQVGAGRIDSGRLAVKKTSLISPQLVTPPPLDQGPLNRCGIWLCNGHTSGGDTPTAKWIGLTASINIPTSKIYCIGMGGDNRVRAFVDGALFKEDDPGYGAENFRIWHVYPVYLEAGKHTLLVQGYNQSDIATFGLEIYGNRADSLQYAHSYADLQMIFSTRDVVGQSFPQNFSCPMGYNLDTSGGHYVCRTSLPSSRYANPMANGILGNWKPQRNYAYYAARVESDPATATDIRHNGRISNFHPFWAFQSSRLMPQYDTTRWTWNSEILQYNRKGLETENRDPLGRYNSGLYGYDMQLPTAIIQNGKERESAYEGFEDYNFVPRLCDSACSDKRHLDLSAYANKITTTQKHSGKSSLQLNGSEQATLNVVLSDSVADRARPLVRYNASVHSCTPGVSLLDSISFPGDTLQPVFSPSKGAKILISAWVKEGQDCVSGTYTSNEIVVNFTGSSAEFDLRPSGIIIEGWQRYESVVTIPSAATKMSVTMIATSGIPVYFDDLRIHPFNADMKSFVYHPSNLRLMAQLDENNYATFYEYDDDGTLIRVKKETERGIQTIKETRSALIKQ
jgi:hypothetical protein